VELRDAVVKSDVSEAHKMNLVADIDTIESQLAKPQPNRSVVAAAWETVKAAAVINGCAGFVNKVAELIGTFL
jgi:hypothetical protein